MTMETLRFLMVTTHYPPYHIGGDAVYVQNLSEELVKRGHEVHIANCPQVFDIVNKGGPRELTAPVGRVAAPEMHPIRFRHPRVTALKSYSLGMWGNAEESLRQLTSQIKPDVVHWNNTKAFIGAPFSCERATNIYLAHDFFASCPKASLLKPAGNPCVRPSLCQLCLVRSSKLPQVWRIGGRRALRIPSDFRVVSHSAFLAGVLASDGIRVSDLIPSFAPDPGPILKDDAGERNSVVFIGILERHKGPQVLLDAFSASAEQQDLTLEIIGEGSLRDGLIERAAKTGARDRIKIPGRISRDEIRAAMRRARAVVVPSVWYENCPLSAIEAFSFGVPIIASDIGGLPEIATADAGSRVFPPGSVTELSQELISVHENREHLREQMNMARKAYEVRYSPDRHIDKYLKLL